MAFKGRKLKAGSIPSRREKKRGGPLFVRTQNDAFSSRRRMHGKKQAYTPQLTVANGPGGQALTKKKKSPLGKEKKPKKKHKKHPRLTKM